MTDPGRSVWSVRGVVTGGVLAAAGALIAAVASTRDARWLELYTTRLSCVTETSQTRVFAVERWVGIGVGALLLASAWPAARWAGRSTPGAPTAAVGRSALAAVLALVTCELVLRVVHPVIAPKVVTNLPRANADPKLGWRYQPLSTKITEFPDDGLTIEYDIDADGDRARSIHETPDHDAPTLLFAGESITVGIGVPWDETYPALVAGSLGLQGTNLGVHAYGMDQVYLRTLEALDSFRRPVALVTIVLADELERSLAAYRQHLALSSDGSLEVDAAPAFWRESTLRDLLLRVTRYQNGEAIDLARAILRSTAAHARARGALPLFVMTNFGPPCLPDASGAPPLEHVLFDDLGAPHVRVDLDPSWQLRDDPHPDARASRQLADSIERALTRLGVGGHASVAPDLAGHGE